MSFPEMMNWCPNLTLKVSTVTLPTSHLTIHSFSLSTSGLQMSCACAPRCSLFVPDRPQMPYSRTSISIDGTRPRCHIVMALQGSFQGSRVILSALQVLDIRKIADAYASIAPLDLGSRLYTICKGMGHDAIKLPLPSHRSNAPHGIDRCHHQL